MSSEYLKYEIRPDRVGHILLNRPERLNAINRELREELWAVLEAASNDDDVAALVVSGAPRLDGRGNFSAGADMKETAQSGAGGFSQDSLGELVRSMFKRTGSEGPTLMAICDRLETMDKPSIAAIDGVCTAGGLELALSCDIRVAARTAQISDLHVKNLGHIGGGGVAVRLARTVGPAWAKQIMLTGDPLDPDVALRIGLVNGVCSTDHLLDEAFTLAAKIAAQRPEAVAMAKAVIGASADLDAGTALRYSVLGRATLYSRSSYEKFASRSSDPERSGGG